jgi:rare lipoprotein A
MRLPVSKSLPLAFLALTAACMGGESQRIAKAPALPANGPAADYPVVIGAPYDVGGVSHTPVDRMNYDAVGRASLGSDGGDRITAAHHTLPVPSYVEVTSLDSGRTILVRIERRGPLTGNPLIELSPGAALQLGLAGQLGHAVRVRRVNPVEPERALLRAGQPAPARMDTPRSLVNVLQRKLDAQEGVTRVAVQTAPDPAPEAKPAKPGPVKLTKPAAKPQVEPKPDKKPAALAAAGAFNVQVGSFASKANADAVASKLGTAVTQTGKLWRVRMGPFAERAEAEAALARARAAGYRDAQIQKAG